MKEFTVSQWIMKKNNFKSPTLIGEISVETDKAFKIKAFAVIKESEHCLRCGREIKNEISRAVGYGPECSDKLGIPRDLNLEDLEKLRKYVAKKTLYEGWVPRSHLGYADIGRLTLEEQKALKPSMKLYEDVYKTGQDDKIISIGALDNEIKIEFEYDRKMVKAVKNIPNAKWNKKDKIWTIPKNVEGLKNIQKEFSQYKDYTLEINDDLTPLIKEKDREHEVQKIKTKTDLEQPNETKFDAWEHQLQAYHYLANKDSVLLYMGMGTGKSKVTIDTIMNNDDMKRILIVCPNSVVDVWREEFEKHTVSDGYQIEDNKKGTVAQRTKRALKNYKLAEQRGLKGIYVCNYEIVFRKHFKAFMDEAKIDTIICDESHRIKSHKSATSKAMYKYSKLPTINKKICLTGTPMPNSPLDIFGQMRFLNENVFGRYWTKFQRQYAVMGGYGGYEVKGYQNQDELQHKMYGLTYRAGSDVLDLPDVTHVKRYAELSGETLKAYKQMERDLIVQVEKGELVANNALSKLLRLQQIASGYMPTENEGELVTLGNEKLDVFKETIQDIDKDEPLIVFCRFRYDIEKVKRVLSLEGRTVAELSGNENKLREWKNGEYNSIVVQVQAGGVGVDLTRAKYCIYYSLGFSLGDYEQSLARIHRPGQESNVTYIHVIAKNTVDEKIYKALDSKKKIVEDVLDNFIQ